MFLALASSIRKRGPLFLDIFRALKGLAMKLRPYKHLLLTYQPIVPFSTTYPWRELISSERRFF